MGKAKQKKNLSEKVQSGKKKKHDVKNNPFEVKINRQKFQVLGRKSKHDKGLPGISRSKAIKKRVETLLVEYKQKDKVNSFIDRRFGEFNPNMTVEEKMTKRFMMEHQRQLKKSDLFNLNKDEELTHYGRSLADGQGMTDFIESADDDDPDDRGLLSAEFTAAANFGGPGIERNTLEGEQAEKRNKSRKELLEEMIANSKMMKYEQQNERERAQDLTKKLDEQWKDIRLLLTHKGAEDKAPEIKKVESYDMVVRELGFEMKAQPTDRLKSAEELARQEQQRLQSLEADRLRRMRGEKATVASRRRKHESADDLHDDFHVEHHERTLLSYQDGKWNVDRLNKGAIEGGDDSNIVKQPEENEEVDYGDDDEEGSGAEFDEREEQKGKEEFGDDGDDNEEEGSGAEFDEREEQKGKEEFGDDCDDNEEEGSGVESDGEEENMSNETDGNGLLDFESKSDEASSAEEENVESEKVLGQNESDKSEKVESIQRMKTMCEAEGELPYVFAAPASLTELRKLLEQYDVEQQCTVIERMIKCNHPSLPESNKENLQNLFEFLLLYVGKLTRLTPPNLLAADKLTRSLFDLAHLFPKAAAHAMQDVLQKSQAKLSKKKHYPGLEELLFLKLISIIFPTSDFRHPVVTPAMVYMSQVLTQCPVQNLRQLSVGLFVCNLFLEFVSLSRRLVPELLTFLHGSLGQALPQPTTPDFQPPTSVWHASRCHALLVVSNQSTFGSWRNLRLPLSVLNTGPQTDDPLDCDHFRISALALTLELIRDCVKLYNGLPAFPELFHPIKVLLTQHLKLNNYPTPVQELAKVVCHSLTTPRTLTPMVYQKQKPTPIQMFHPKVEQVYESGHKKSGRKEELKQFQRRYQRELKGAVRELRKDNQFLARQQLAEQLERDAERRRKVKEIRHLLSTQEGEYKAMKKKYVNF